MLTKSIHLALVAGLLTGCVSVLPEPTVPDALYQIDAAGSNAGLTQHVIVREPDAARLYAGQGMVSVRDDGGLRLMAGAEWAGPATRQMQFAMIDSFAIGSDGHALAPENGAMALYELSSRISELKLEGTRAVCRMQVSLVQSADRALVARTELVAERTAQSRSTRDRALALREAASNCALQASAFAIETLNPGS